MPVPSGEVVFDGAARARSPSASAAAVVVVKAQIHAGGRGKGGGVKVVKGPQSRGRGRREDARHDAGHPPDRPGRAEGRAVLVEQGLQIKRELYLGIVIDRASERPVLMASRKGASRSRRSRRRRRSGSSRSSSTRARPGAVPGAQAGVRARARGRAGRPGGHDDDGALNTFSATDASLIEINPLIVTEDGSLLALDAKMNFDDNALYRHPDIKELRDIGEEDPLEVEASKYSLNYIKLDGTIGCMVNGAGLAMATMDIIKLAGGEPANFLDVGGGANAEQIRNAFRILMSDTSVKAVLINIFGGILRCDVLAAGVIAAVKELGVPVPDRHPDGRHQRRAGQADAERERPELHDRRHDERGGRAGRRAGQ